MSDRFEKMGVLHAYVPGSTEDLLAEAAALAGSGPALVIFGLILGTAFAASLLSRA